MITEFTGLPLFAFGLIMIDCPWRFHTWSSGGLQKSPDRHYRTMPIEEIRAMPVGHHAAKDCILWMWGTNPMVDQQIEVGRSWGFRFVTMGTWVKRTKTGKLGFGTGYALRCASEPFLLFTNGDPSFGKSVRTVIEGPLREHSRKPDECYIEAERLSPGVEMRADIFSRQTRAGWTTWGDQSTAFD